MPTQGTIKMNPNDEASIAFSFINHTLSYKAMYFGQVNTDKL